MSRTQTVITDTTGDLARELAAHVGVAQSLFERGSQVGDETTLGVWLSVRDEWRLSTTQLLTTRLGSEVAAEFLRAVSCRQSTSTPSRTLRAERRALQDGIELLTALHDTQIGQNFGRLRNTRTG